MLVIRRLAVWASFRGFELFRAVLAACESGSNSLVEPYFSCRCEAHDIYPRMAYTQINHKIGRGIVHYTPAYFWGQLRKLEANLVRSNCISALRLSVVVGFIFCSASILAQPLPDANCYVPVDGGWRISIRGDAPPPNADHCSKIGEVVRDPSCKSVRLNRRPLFPPADKSMILAGDDLTKMEKWHFRPLVLAYNEPQFLFDYSAAGGLMGHLFIGLQSGGTSKWLHQWSNITVSYIDGAMHYRLTDPSFPGVRVSLSASPLATSVGLMVRIKVDGAQKSSLVWMYGGASTFFTNWNMVSPRFTLSPEDCERNDLAWKSGVFTLTRGFSDADNKMFGPAGGLDQSILSEDNAIGKIIPGWKAVMCGGSSWKGKCGFGNAAAAADSPGKLLESSDWNASEKQDCVAVQSVRLSDAREGCIVVGMGANIERDIANPGLAWSAALKRNKEIADRIVVHTPDRYLNAAVPMMAFATEGTWGDSAILHGGWTWREPYLGWRGWYGSDCCGWTDRVRKSIQSHIRFNRITEGPDKGALGSIISPNPVVFYNMDEVFMDQVRQYLDYTGDIELMKQVFPVLQSIVEWENRRLRPGSEHLYENALNTWISDQHWYTRAQCTQASAYMLRAYDLLAKVAAKLSYDPTPYAEQAAMIRADMQSKLWMRRPGCLRNVWTPLAAGCFILSRSCRPFIILPSSERRTRCRYTRCSTGRILI